MRQAREARVLIVDVQPDMRAGLAANLAVEGFVVVGETDDPLAAADAAARLLPDVVLLDLALVERHGARLVGRLRESSGGARIVVLSSLEDERLVAGALRAGADRHLRKDAFREELIAAVCGETGPRGAALSARETEILRQIARGRSDAEIGAALGVAESTIASHVASILRKTGARGRTQAAIRGLEQGDISL